MRSDLVARVQDLGVAFGGRDVYRGIGQHLCPIDRTMDVWCDRVSAARIDQIESRSHDI